MSKTTTLRAALRDGTRDLHDALDDRLGAFDLTESQDYFAFLQVQLAGFAPLASRGSPEARDVTARLHADLVALDAAPRTPAQPQDAPLDPLAVRYVTLGARLGATVLRRQWQAGTDARVRAASAFFSAPPLTEEWQALCAQLSALPGTDTSAKTIISDARTIFDWFLSAAAQQTIERPAHA